MGLPWLQVTSKKARLNFSFAIYFKAAKAVAYRFYFFFGKPLSNNLTKRYSVDLMLYQKRYSFLEDYFGLILAKST